MADRHSRREFMGLTAAGMAGAITQPWQLNARALWAALAPHADPDLIVVNAKVYTMDPAVPGRVQRIVNIHNPSIEVHFAGAGNNTGTAIILAPGGGHSTLVVGLGPIHVCGPRAASRSSRSRMSAIMSAFT